MPLRATPMSNDFEPIELTVTPDRHGNYWVCNSDGDPLFAALPEVWVDLAPYLAARTPSEHGVSCDCTLIVRLQGADYDLAHNTIGALAATPIVNTVPVQQPPQCLYAGPQL
jgi:hypothetical protein